MKRVTIAAAVVLVCCVAALTADYIVARLRAPGDDKRIEALQQQVRSNASVSPKLEAEQKRIADRLAARKARIKWLAWIAIAAAAVFVTGAKQRVAVRDSQSGSRGTRADQGVCPTKKFHRAAVCKQASQLTVDLSVVDEIVATHGRTAEAAIPILQAIQAHFRYLPDEAMERVCELTEITPAQISGTSSFYTRFRKSPVGEHIVRVCHGTACHVSGARQITDQLRRNLEIPDGSDTDPSRTFTIEEVACLGCCSLAPVLMVDEHTVGKLTPATACDALAITQTTEPA